MWRATSDVSGARAGSSSLVVAMAVALASSVQVSSQSIRTLATAPPADVLLAAAVKQAGAEGKSVFVEFGAAWCAPCRQFDALFAAPSLRRFWAEHFVIARITVWEHGNEALNHPGGDRLMELWGGGRGIPYYAVLDGTGKLLAGQSGYPSGMADIPPFMALVARAAPALTTPERKSLEEYLVARGDGLGSIAGRVTDDRGRPVAGALVAIVSRAWTHGAWQPVAGGRATTDAAGRYVIDGVSAGSHPVVVTSPPPARGARPAPLVFPPTFFPSAERLADARPVTVTRGQGLANIDLTTARRTPVAVDGVVRSAAGTAASGAALTLTNMDWPLHVLSATASATGAFNFRDVWPGRYTLAARLSAAMSPDRSAPEIGVLPITVSIDGPLTLEVRAAPGSTLAGIVRFDGSPPMTAADRAAIRVAAIPVNVPVGIASSTARAAVGSAGAFRFEGLHGRHAIRMEGLPPGWLLASVRLGGVELADTALDSSAARTLAGVEVLVTNRAGSLSGTVIDAARQPVAGGAAIVFAADVPRWTYPSRFIRSAPIQADGTFRVAGLPPGDYLVTRVAPLMGGWDAPESLESLRSRATAVRLAAGERRVLSVAVPR